MRALDPTKVAQLRAWLEAGQPGTAWLMGWPGSGMTSMVQHLTAGMEAVWMTGSALRSRGFFRDVCSNGVAVNGRRKVLVLDELDVVLSNDTTMMDVAYVTKRNTKVQVVCILKSSRAARACDLAKKASLVLDFPRPSTEDMLRAVEHIAAEEGLPTHDARRLCEAVPGDVRHVVQTLRASTGGVRDVGMHTADAVACLLTQTVPVAKAINLFLADAGGVPAGIFEAYTGVVQDVSDCLHYLDMASLADVVDEHIHAKQRWDLWDVYGAFSTAAALTLPRAPAALLDKFGTQWNKHYQMCNKLKNAKAVRLSQAERGVQPLATQDLGYVRRMLGCAVMKSADEAAAVCRSAGLDAKAALHVMRLWSGEYKLTTHAKVVKALGPA